MNAVNDNDRAAPAGAAVDLLAGLAEESILPQFRIYDRLNGDFVDSLSPTKGWHLVVDEGGAASACFRRGMLKIDVADGGRRWYAVQVCCLPLAISAGYWSVTFEARSGRARRMILDLAHVGDDWFAYAGRPVVRLTPEWTRYEYSFYNDKPAEPTARFEFNLGGEDVSAEFRNVRVVRDAG